MMLRSRIPTVAVVTAATVLGVAAGMSLKVSAGLGLSAIVSPDNLARGLLTALTLFVLRRWLTGFDRRNRLALAEVAERQRDLKLQHAANLISLGMRSAEVNLQAEAAQEKLDALDDRLTAIAKGRAAEQQALETLRAEHADLLREYNALVLETIQTGASRFRQTGQRLAPVPRRPPADLVPEPRTQLLRPKPPPAASPN